MVGALVPFATGETTGLPEEPTPNRAWLMCPGTPRAHIMIGPIPYGLSEEIGWQACAPTDAGAQSDEALIAEATSPLPEQMKTAATVVVTDDAGNRRVLRQGTNSLVCSPDGPAPGFQASCSDASLRSSGDVPTALAEYGRLKAQGIPEEEILATITAGVRAGTLASMPPGAMHFILSGADKQSAEQLIVVRLPDATAESTGLATEPPEPGNHSEKRIPSARLADAVDQHLAREQLLPTLGHGPGGRQSSLRRLGPIGGLRRQQRGDASARRTTPRPAQSRPSRPLTPPREPPAVQSISRVRRLGPRAVVVASRHPWSSTGTRARRVRVRPDPAALTAVTTPSRRHGATLLARLKSTRAPRRGCTAPRSPSRSRVSKTTPIEPTTSRVGRTPWAPSRRSTGRRENSWSDRRCP